MAKELMIGTYPATFQEVAHLRAEQERRRWYLVERGEEIGITSEPEPDDEVISTYEND